MSHLTRTLASILIPLVGFASTTINVGAPQLIPHSTPLNSTTAVAKSSSEYLSIWVDTMEAIMQSPSIDGVSWMLNTISAITTTALFNPSICSGPSGFVVSWFNSSFIGGANFPAVSFSTDGVLWRLPQTLTNITDLGVGSYVSAAANNAGFLAAFTVSIGATNPNHSYSSFSADGLSWSPYSQVDNSSFPLPSYTTSVSGYGTTFISGWADNSHNAFASLSNTSPYISWTAHQLTTNNTAYSEVTVSATNQGFMAAWVDLAGNGYYSFSTTGTSWSAPQQFATGINASIGAAIALGEASGGYIAAWQDSSNNGQVSAFNVADRTWSTPVQFATNLSTAFNGPLVGIASSGGNPIVLTWTSGTDPYSCLLTLTSSATTSTRSYTRPANRRGGFTPSNPG